MPIGELAGWPLCQPDTDLALLLDHHYFFSQANVHRCYSLAGGFTGFLIRQFGWSVYREFYRGAERWTFRGRFKKHFSVSLERAWQMWRESL